MTTDIKNLCEGYHLLEQELYDSAVSDDEIDYIISKDDIGKWIYFDEDGNHFMSAEHYNSILYSVINTEDDSLADIYKERIEDLCELNFACKILQTPDVDMYEFAFYQVTLKDFEDENASDSLDEEINLGQYVYFDGAYLLEQCVWEDRLREAWNRKYYYAEEVEYGLIVDMLQKLNSKEYLTITQEQIDEQNADYDSSYLSGTSSGDWVYDDGEVLVSQDCVYDWASKSKRKDKVNYYKIFYDLKKFNKMDYRRNGIVSSHD